MICCRPFRNLEDNQIYKSLGLLNQINLIHVIVIFKGADVLIKHHNPYLVEVTEELHDEGDCALGSERRVRLTEQVAYHLHVATNDLYFGVVEAVALLPQLSDEENHEVHDF